MWTVIVEVAGDLMEQPVARENLEQLLEELGTGRVAVSYSPHRYSARFDIGGVDVTDAADNALTVWRYAVERVGLPNWPLVRLEATAADRAEVPLRELVKTA